MSDRYRSKGFTHESAVNESVEWYTPPEIFEALDFTFDLDPCSPGAGLSYVPALRHYTVKDDGLTSSWFNEVWLTPTLNGATCACSCACHTDPAHPRTLVTLPTLEVARCQVGKDAVYTPQSAIHEPPADLLASTSIRHAERGPSLEREVCTNCEGDVVGRYASTVWVNPPYGPHTGVWMEKLAAHGDGMALVFARTDVRWFQFLCTRASLICFVDGRIKFFQGNKVNRGGSPGAGSMILAFGERAGAVLQASNLGVCFSHAPSSNPVESPQLDLFDSLPAA